MLHHAARIVRRPPSRVGVVPRVLALRTEMMSGKINQRSSNLYRSESQKTLRRFRFDFLQ